MKKIIFSGLALILASCFAAVQFGAGAAFAGPSAVTQQGKYQPQPQIPSQHPTQQPRMHGEHHRMPQMHNPLREAFTGTVFKQDGHYVLLSKTKTYQLSNQTMAKKFNNERVMVTGKLGSNGNTIQVKNIKKFKPGY